MDDIQLSSSPKSKMASSYRLRCLSWVLETNLKEEVCRGFIFANLFDSLYLSVRLWWNILVANLATNFQDLVAKGKNLVVLAPVLGVISRPGKSCLPVNRDILRAERERENKSLNIYVFKMLISNWKKNKCLCALFGFTFFLRDFFFSLFLWRPLRSPMQRAP